jgi:hypothetical protein
LKILAFPRSEHSDWVFKTPCTRIKGEVFQVGCGAEVELTVADIYRVEEHSIAGSKISWQWKCPVCAAENFIPAGELPKNVNFPIKEKWMRDKRDNLLQQIYFEYGKDGVLAAAEHADVDIEVLRRFNLLN